VVNALAIDGIRVRFGGITALDGVSLAVGPGEVAGLIGPNGAGKTTLFNVVCGLQRHEAGTVRLGNRDLAGLGPHLRARLGLGRTFQRLEVFGSMTVRENVLVAAEIRRRWARDDADPKAVAAELLAQVGLEAVAERRVEELPTGTARLVEVARALAAVPSVLLLDEPSSGLDEQETDELSVLLARVAGAGVGILLVEHDVELVMSTCARIFVLNFGRLLAAGTPDEIRADEQVEAAYLGRRREPAVAP
jgi:branched-chain amino acid transport system ATP-binding protein